MISIEQAEQYLQARSINEALAAYRAAEAHGLDADRCAAGRWMCHMLTGNYEDAWKASDGIRQRGAPAPDRFWNGDAIDGKRVLTRCLHGYGDAVQYLRWLPELHRRAGEVIVQAAPAMLPLLRMTHAPGRLTSWNPPGQTDEHLWDMQVEVAELPYLFRASPSTLPPPLRIHPDEEALHSVREHLGPQTKPRNGLVWTGSDYDSARSIPFDKLHDLLGEHTVEFWSLQASGDNQHWLAYAARRGWSSRTIPGGLDQLAAFTSAMDLVITVDTLVAHLAGSLQVPTWLLLKREADWRWMLDREDTPWYPTMRLFRQHCEGDWLPVLHRVCQQMRDWCEENRP